MFVFIVSIYTDMDNTPVAITKSDTAIKFSTEEMAEFQKIRDAYAEATLSYGQLAIRLKEIKETEKKLDEAYLGLQKKEEEFLDKVVAKYGEGSLNPNNGTFTPTPKKAE